MIYFTPHEFRCRCGKCELAAEPRYPASGELRAYLDALRLVYGAPIIVTSGWRCPEHNSYVGGAQKSDHLCGLAADITTSNGDISELLDIHKIMWEHLPSYHRMYQYHGISYIHISLWSGRLIDAF